MQEALIRWLMTSGDEDPPSLEALLNRPKWHQRAACRGVGVDAFIVSRGRPYSQRELCEDCPVRRECLKTALADPDLQGLWGGTSEIERRRMRRGVA